MEDLRDALAYVVDISAAKDVRVLEINKRTFTDNNGVLNEIKVPKPCPIRTNTLTSIVDYIKSGIDATKDELILQIDSPSNVTLYSTLNGTNERYTYMECIALLPNNIQFGRPMDTESFNIMLQSAFRPNEDRDILLKVAGTIKETVVKDTGDDGVSQAVTCKTGIASVADVLVPNPAILAPFRTFPEVVQPESKFIFRMSDGPKCMLIEADGGAWRNEAMNLIFDFLMTELQDNKNIKILS